MKGRRHITFGVHQAVEYVMGCFLIAQAAAFGARDAPIALGVGCVLIVWPACARGPLGLARRVSPRLHAFGDLLIVVLLAASPWLFFTRPGSATVLVVEGLAALLAWLLRSTAYIAPPRVTKSSAFAPALERMAVDGPRRLGRLVGRMSRPQKPPTD